MNFCNLRLAINMIVPKTELWLVLNLKDSKIENDKNFIPETSVCAMPWCFRL